MASQALKWIPEDCIANLYGRAVLDEVSIPDLAPFSIHTGRLRIRINRAPSLGRLALTPRPDRDSREPSVEH